MSRYTKIDSSSLIPTAANEMNAFTGDDSHQGEVTPAYKILRDNNLLTTNYRVDKVANLEMRPANSTPEWNSCVSLAFLPCCGCSCYFHNAEVSAGNIKCIEDGRGNFEFLGPGIHQIQSWFVRVGSDSYCLATPNLALEHGDRAIVTVEQGYIGFAMVIMAMTYFNLQ